MFSSSWWCRIPPSMLLKMVVLLCVGICVLRCILHVECSHHRIMVSCDDYGTRKGTSWLGALPLPCLDFLFGGVFTHFGGMQRPATLANNSEEEILQKIEAFKKKTEAEKIQVWRCGGSVFVRASWFVQEKRSLEEPEFRWCKFCEIFKPVRCWLSFKCVFP